MVRPITICMIVLGLSCLLISPQSAHAAVVLSNLTSVQGSGATLTGTSNQLEIHFTVASDTDYFINTVKMKLMCNNSSLANNCQLNVNIQGTVFPVTVPALTNSVYTF